ncbi:MAG: arsenite methyltransferase [Armatimonadota bacterium]
MIESETDDERDAVRDAPAAVPSCCGRSAELAASACWGGGSRRAAGFTPDEIRQAVRANYARVSERAAGACCGAGASALCCGTAALASAQAASARLGYSEEELAAVPEGANLGLGCGNPQAVAALRPGETVLDLGSGGGFDCFLAARRVGPEGRVIGVDMTPEMVHQARANARRGGYANVEFRLGEIEHLPVADGSVDVIISNCVINLSPDKPVVYREAFRVLRPGGRIAISDVVRSSEAELPAALRDDPALLSGCVAGAASVGEVEQMLREAGFAQIRVATNAASREYIKQWAPGRGIEDYVISAVIEAVKPK